VRNGVWETGNAKPPPARPQRQRQRDSPLAATSPPTSGLLARPATWFSPLHLLAAPLRSVTCVQN